MAKYHESHSKYVEFAQDVGDLFDDWTHFETVLRLFRFENQTEGNAYPGTALAHGLVSGESLGGIPGPGRWNSIFRAVAWACHRSMESPVHDCQSLPLPVICVTRCLNGGPPCFGV